MPTDSEEGRTDHERQSAQEFELRLAIAEIRGELRKTPSRFDYYGVSVVIAGIFAAAFSGLVYLYLSDRQSTFEEDVVEIIEKREEIQNQRYRELIEDLKGPGVQPKEQLPPTAP